MENQQMRIIVKEQIPVVSFTGNCKVEGIADLSNRLQEYSVAGQRKFVFDFSACKLINSPAMGELLDAILLVDRDFEGHIVVCGLETLFTISGIIPIAQEASTITEAIELLKNVED